MDINTAKNVLVSNYANPAVRNRTVMLLGASGIGKSQIVAQAAKELDLQVIDMRLAQFDPTDLKGVPYVVDGVTHWATPGSFPHANQPSIVFLDEITSAPPAIQAAAYQLVLDRAVGDYKLPEHCMVVAAGNRQSDRGVTFQIAAPLLNRMTLIEVATSTDSFLAHGAASGLDPRVMAFIKAREDFLHKYDKDSYGKQFPSPRSWFAVSDKLAMNYPDHVRVELVRGDVGHEAGVSFEEFMRIWDVMPNLNRILEEPDSEPVPERKDVQYCVAMGLSFKLDKRNFEKAYRYIQRMPNELGTLCIKLGYDRDPDLFQSKAFTQWALDNKDVLRG
jgi:hypothetical protein